MNKEKLNLESRIHLLEQRDPIANAAIVKKLQRQLREVDLKENKNE